jgi:hypothetical protein
MARSSWRKVTCRHTVWVTGEVAQVVFNISQEELRRHLSRAGFFVEQKANYRGGLYQWNSSKRRRSWTGRR